MLNIRKDPALTQRGIPFGLVEVRYPDPAAWRAEDFYALAETELAGLKERFAQYDRKAVFSEHPYSRFFKKFKKTYPVMLQLESFLLKSRPFPRSSPAAEVPFLAELMTLVLSGAHDVQGVQGEICLYSALEKEPFPGMRGEEAHTYPGDVCGRDEGGVIFSMIAGADERTCVKPGSRHVFYPVFGVPDQPSEALREPMEQIARYARVLSSEAEVESMVL